jgi:hypothetical protein
MVKMKNIYKILVFFSLILITHSCEDIVEGINENPNDLTLSDIEERLFLAGGELANIQLQCGHLNRVSGMYSGQLIGFAALYSIFMDIIYLLENQTMSGVTYM